MSIVQLISESIKIPDIRTNINAEIVNKKINILSEHIEVFSEIEPHSEVIAKSALSDDILELFKSYGLIVDIFDPANSSISCFKINIDFISGRNLQLVFFDLKKAHKAYNDILNGFSKS